jgi:hypothetical protein
VFPSFIIYELDMQLPVSVEEMGRCRFRCRVSFDLGRSNCKVKCAEIAHGNTCIGIMVQNLVYEKKNGVISLPMYFT